jgi:thiamine kinase-like enzyme
VGNIYLNNPNLICQCSVPSVGCSIEQSILFIIDEIINHKINLELKDIEIKPLTGGITNLLYLVFIRPLHLKVIVRLFGEGTSDFLDRNIENIIFSTLSKLNIGPIFYGLFLNGRIEGYIPSRTLTPEETKYPKYIPFIAETVAQFHAQKIDGIPTDICLWKMIDKFLFLAEKAIEEDKNQNKHKLSSNEALKLLSIRRMRIQYEWLKNYFSSTSSYDEDNKDNMETGGKLFGCTSVFCHNDLLSGNILLLNPTSAMSHNVENNLQSECKMKLIDFEYAGYNVRAWDIANHFCGRIFICLYYSCDKLFFMCYRKCRISSRFR